jgi:hypothetical protein
MPSSRRSMPRQISEPFGSRDTFLLPKHAVRAFVETIWPKDRSHSDFSRDPRRVTVQVCNLNSSHIRRLGSHRKRPRSKPTYAYITLKLPGTRPRTCPFDLTEPPGPSPAAGPPQFVYVNAQGFPSSHAKVPDREQICIRARLYEISALELPRICLYVGCGDTRT